jgi:hypothetical protein
MGTWVAAIVETTGRPDFWEVARRHGVEPLTRLLPPHALIDCGLEYGTSFRVAENLSRDLGAMAIGFALQTCADVHVTHVFARGERIRRLGYDRDDDGWTLVEGAPQQWERVYFFDEASSTAADGRWPDMLDDELSAGDIARYEEAKRTGDPTSVMDLLRPSSMGPMLRVCGFFGVNPDSPAARWKKPSLLSRLFGRSGT